jgi:hypothetical protein
MDKTLLNALTSTARIIKPMTFRSTARFIKNKPDEPDKQVVEKEEIPETPVMLDQNPKENNPVPNFANTSPVKEFVVNSDPTIDLNNDSDKLYLLDAMVKAESGYNPNAKSHAGAEGIAQFMPDTWKAAIRRGWAPEGSTPYDRDVALKAQRHYMDWLLQRPIVSSATSEEEKIRRALASYNAGIGNVTKAVNKARELGDESLWEENLPRTSETIPYMDKIIQTIQDYKNTSYVPSLNWGIRSKGNKGILYNNQNKVQNNG